MGRKKYYCDFCDRSFNDDQTTRGKHFSSVAHSQFKQQHYFKFRDPETVLREEFAKKPCKNYMAEGCSYEGSCRFSHYSPEELTGIEQELMEREQKYFEIPSLSCWLQKQDTIVSDPVGESSEQKPISVWSHEIPSELSSSIVLPPSIQPFYIKDNVMCASSTWGD